MNSFKDELILSLMREKIKREIRAMTNLDRNQLDRLANRILNVIANTAKDMEKK